MSKKRLDKPILLIALGGNALIKKGQRGTAAEQFENLKEPISQIARLSKKYRIIITHGNGPQVGNLLLQQESCKDVPNLPLEILVAQTEGQIGYMIESTLDSELMQLGILFRPLVSLITYVVVDRKDPAFDHPTKPIGPVFSKEDTARLDYACIETAKGFRRVVASPLPVTIVEKKEIKELINLDFIVICCGGGGIPVIREGRAFNGVNAVIDKDLASARLALEVGCDIFLIATDEAGVMLDYNTPNQNLVRRLSVEKAEQYLTEGHFPTGSMGPKVVAAKNFAAGSGKRAVITHITTIEQAVLSADAGTEFAPKAAV
jgi:carbamate kinase